MNIGKWLVLSGGIIIVIGILFLIGQKIGIPFGKFPGDITIKKEKYSVYFPIVTSIVVSIGLTLLINFILWLFRK